MNSISRVVLLSAVSCFVNGTDLSCSFAKQLEGIPKSSINSYNTHHTYINNDLHKTHLSSRLFEMISGEEQKVASVCFITDTGNCSGDKFGNTETPGGGTPNGNDPEYDTIPELCEDAGYTKTSCPTGQHLVNPCPSDNRYYERCDTTIANYVMELIRKGLVRLAMENIKNVATSALLILILLFPRDM